MQAATRSKPKAAPSTLPIDAAPHPAPPLRGASGPIGRASLVGQVYDRIRADIMSVKIPPNARISVDNLVRELGVSQTPIREALSMLEANGLVIRQHFVGYCTASKLDRAQFDHLYEIRQLLEPAAAGLAARQMSDEALAELARLAHRMDRDPADSTRASYDQFADEDSEFHARIALGSGNPLIAESLARLHTHLHIFRLRFHKDVTDRAFVEHRGIVDALQRRDARAARREMQAHLQRSYERLVGFTAGVGADSTEGQGGLAAEASRG